MYNGIRVKKEGAVHFIAEEAIGRSEGLISELQLKYFE
jgi:hypothetical protein